MKWLKKWLRSMARAYWRDRLWILEGRVAHLESDVRELETKLCNLRHLRACAQKKLDEWERW